MEYGHQEGRTTTVEGVGAEPALSPQDCQLFLSEFELFKGTVYKFNVGEGVHGTVQLRNAVYLKPFNLSFPVVRYHPWKIGEQTEPFKEEQFAEIS